MTYHYLSSGYHLDYQNTSVSQGYGIASSMLAGKHSNGTLHRRHKVDKDTLLKMHLAACVPIEIAELQKQGGAQDWHFEAAQERMWMLREEPEAHEALCFALRFKTRHTLSVLVETLAVLAFNPGGVTAFGCHFEACSSFSLSGCHGN